MQVLLRLRAKYDSFSNKLFRESSFKSILSQEIGWFDAKENSTGILTGKLATEATQVRIIYTFNP